jgi:protein-disulfide isomerase
LGGSQPVSAARPRDLETRFRFSRFCHKELARERETTGKQASGVNPVTETTEKAAPNRTLYIVLGLVLAVAVAAGAYYWRGGFDQSGARVADKDKVDPDVAVLMEPGPLPDIIIGSANAPNTIVEYASMTCPHCAQFQTEVFPELKKKYIDTGKVRYMLREFPLDNLAAAAFMLARCAGDDRYYAMVDAMFSTQESWAMPGVDAKEKLLQIARQAGISKEQFDQCLANKELFGKIVKTREIANDKFQVDSTPTFFVNGKRLKGDHQLKDFDVALGEAPAPADADKGKTEGSTPPPTGQ